MWSFSSTNVQAEIFKRFGIDDGLPNATIYSVAQDQRGFLWLGSTNSGLLRFDGYRFHEFPVLSEAELSTKQTPDVGVIIIDTANNLWAGTWGFGLSKIDSETGQLQRFTTKNGLAGDKVQVLFQSADKAVW
ncbi:ligand-binding sensor domain-containing protein, partial [Rheinheimera salexigens]